MNENMNPLMMMGQIDIVGNRLSRAKSGSLKESL